MNHLIKHRRLLLPFLATAFAPALFAAETFRTAEASITVDDKGFITSIVAARSGKEYCPAGRPSALMSLHEQGKPDTELVPPESAVFDDAGRRFTLKYPNGSTAVVKIESKADYLRLRLISLTNREKVDNIVWGPVNTTISGKIGDIIGVVRSRDFAIGMYGLDDNTVPGPGEGGPPYYIHTEDPEKNPLPPQYKEGQRFNIGGDGINDVAFYSHPEEYFHMSMGAGATLKPEFGSSIAYCSLDRRRPRVYAFPVVAGQPRNGRVRHMVSDPLPGVDFIGSSVALYAVPDDKGLPTLRTIFKNEGLPYITDRDGRWIRDPAAARPTLYWNGPVDKAIAYAKAMGFRDISRDTGEFYSDRPSGWVGHVNLGGKNITYKEFADMCHKAGLTHGGLHTLCMFLQGGVSHDVTPVPNENLLTVCRTRLAKDISATDTTIVVTDPSYLAEKGTYTFGDVANYLRIGGEMLKYDGISDKAPWTLTGVKRGHASKAVAHKAGDELVKLMTNCYHGFVPDMKLMPAYAEDYAQLMVRNGMDTINFDGYESTLYGNHGYYAVNVFNRRLFESYHEKTGKWPRVTGSCIFGGAWAYFNVCDLGGGGNMFDAASGRRITEAKDIGDAFSACWYPGTFGIQELPGNLPDAENLMAKAVGWDYTFALSTDARTIDRFGANKEALFKAFNAWQEAREKQLFTKAQKEKLRDPALKFHIVKNGDGTFTLHTFTNDRDRKETGVETVGK